MVPSAIVAIDALPLTINGKLDRKALPDPELQAAADYVAPRTPVEETICAVFADVLGVERVGVTDNFFTLGGHSLMAVRMVSRLRQALGREVALQLLFRHPQVEDLAKAIGEGSPESAVAPILARPAGIDRLALSLAQERLWFLWRLEPDSSAYNIAGAVRLEGALDAHAVRVALTGVVARHEALRTRFEDVDGIAMQVIGAEPVYSWAEHDISDASDQSVRLEGLLREHGLAPFDLEHGPLLRAGLVRLGDAEHVLMLAMHHIVSDGWSMKVLLNEFGALYVAALEAREADLPPLSIQYGDYSLWQREHLDDEVLDEQLTYWRERLGAEHPVLTLPVDRVRTGARSGTGGRIQRHISKDVAERLAGLSREQGATLFMTLLAAWQLLLHRYSGQSEIRVGVPVAGRDRIETEGLVGFFVNTLVLRGDLAGSMTVADLIAQARERMIEAQANQDVPFARLVEALRPERSLTTTPLFQTLFSYDQADGDGALMLPGLKLKNLAGATSEVQFDLMLDVVERAGNGITLSFGYAGDIFDAATVDRIADHFLELAEHLSADQRLGALGLSVEAPAQEVVSHAFRAVTERIGEQAAARPEATALTRM
jgi:acyl carrier protein